MNATNSVVGDPKSAEDRLCDMHGMEELNAMKKKIRTKNRHVTNMPVLVIQNNYW